MKNILEELWYGNINPQLDATGDDPEIKNLLELMIGTARNFTLIDESASIVYNNCNRYNTKREDARERYTCYRSLRWDGTCGGPCLA